MKFTHLRELSPMFTAQAEQTEKCITAADAAHAYDVAPGAVVRWANKGALLRDGSRLKLRCVRLPGSFRTTKAWLDEFLQAIADDKAAKPDAAPKEHALSPRVARMRADLVEAGFSITT
jgi:hypothetical protein